MNTYQIEVAIFDQESFVAELAEFFEESFEGVLDWTFKD